MTNSDSKSITATKISGSDTSFVHLRDQIDKIDCELLRILDQRAEVVKQVGELKKKQNQKIHDPTREQEILDKITRESHPHLLDGEVKTLFQSLISFFRTMETAHMNRASATHLPNQIQTVGFLGFGLIGASIGLALKNQCPQWNFKIADPYINLSDLQSWCESHQIKNYELVTEADLSGCDLIFLCAPISVNEAKASELVQKNKIVLHTGSVLSDLHGVYGFHPLAGKEQTLFHSAQEDLFFGKVICITNTSHLESDKFTLITSLVSALGAKPWVGDNHLHNQKLAYTSHLIQVLSMAFGSCLAKQNFEENLALLPYTAKQLLRLTGSSYEMWSPIFEKNKPFILQSLQDLQKELRKIEESLKEENDLRTLFNESLKVYNTIYKKGNLP